MCMCMYIYIYTMHIRIYREIHMYVHMYIGWRSADAADADPKHVTPPD